MDSSAIDLNLLGCIAMQLWNAQMKCVLREHGTLDFLCGIAGPIAITIILMGTLRLSKHLDCVPKSQEPSPNASLTVPTIMACISSRRSHASVPILAPASNP